MTGNYKYLTMLKIKHQMNRFLKYKIIIQCSEQNNSDLFKHSSASGYCYQKDVRLAMSLGLK